MNFAKIDRKYFKLGIFAVSASLLLTLSAKALASLDNRASENDSIALAESSRSDRHLCSQQEENIVESFYVETANFFANICQDSSGQLIYIGGEKVNPENAIKLSAIAEEGTGYVAENGDTTYIVTGAALTVVKNGLPILEEHVIYYCTPSGCEDR